MQEVQVGKDCKLLSLSGKNYGKEDNGGTILKEDFNHLRTLKALRIITLRKMKNHIKTLYPQYKIFLDDNKMVSIEDANDEEIIICLRQWNANGIPLDNSLSLSVKELTFTFAIDILQPILQKVDNCFSENKITWTDFLKSLNKNKQFYFEILDEIKEDAIRLYFDQEKIKVLLNKDEGSLFSLFLKDWKPNQGDKSISHEQFNDMYEENNTYLEQLKLAKEQSDDQQKIMNEIKDSNDKLIDKNNNLLETINISLAQQQQLQVQYKISTDRLLFEEESTNERKTQLKRLNLEVDELKDQLKNQIKISDDSLINKQEIIRDQLIQLNQLKDQINKLNEEIQELNIKLKGEREQYSIYQSSTPSASVKSSLSPNKRRSTNKIDIRRTYLEHFTYPTSMYFTSQLLKHDLLFVTEEVNFDDTKDSLFKCISIKLFGAINNYIGLKSAYLEYSNNNKDEYQITETDVRTIVNNFNSIFTLFTAGKSTNIQIWEYITENEFKCIKSFNGSSFNDQTENIYLLYFSDPNENDFKFRIVSPLHIYYEY